MNTSADPILQLRELRSEAPAPSAAAESRARAAMYARPPAPRRRFAVVAAAALIVLFALVAAHSSWTRPQTAAAAVDQLVKTAAAQPPAKLGPNDWIVTHFVSRREWTQDLTQKKLDAWTARAAASLAATSGHFSYSNTRGSRLTKAEERSELAKTQKATERRIARMRAGVNISDLPTTHVTAWVIAPYTTARPVTGFGGGGGGGSNDVHYGSPEQKATAQILRPLGLAGPGIDPEDYGGNEASASPLTAVDDESAIKNLPTDPEAMRAALSATKASNGVDGKGGSPQVLFVKASGVVTSPFANPDQRAAAIRLVAALPGVTIEQHAEDARGREGVGMKLAIRGGTTELIFDADNSQLLGMVVQVDDPAAFVGDSYAGSGKDRVRVIPPFDSATIAVSYDPWTISRNGPPCGPGFCVHAAPAPSQRLRERMRHRAGTR